MKDVCIRCRLSKESDSADALSCFPHAPAPAECAGEGEIQVAALTSTNNQEDTLLPLLQQQLVEASPDVTEAFANTQWQDLL